MASTRTSLYLSSFVVAILAATLVIVAAQERGDSTAAAFPKRSPSTRAEFDRSFAEQRNWGRWGKDDRLGTMNLITDAKRRQAATLAKVGLSVSLSRDAMLQEALDNPRPFRREMAPNFRSDTWTIAYHGEAVTHIDALCHFAHDGLLYNGVPASASNEQGCALGVDLLKNGIVTRGVLIDIPRLRGVEYLEPPTPVFPEEVEAWERRTGVRIGAGDAIFLRTGRWSRRAKIGAWRSLWNQPGFHASIGPWVRQRDVAIVGAEGIAEAKSDPPYFTDGVSQPLHEFLIAGLGMPIIDNVDLDVLARTAARLNRWEFMTVIAPLSVPGATGSPVNVIAVF